MSPNELLRAHALADLRRLIPTVHYWLREHSPEADRELTEPLLREPVRFELTPRETVAARALSDLATYEIRSRAIWSRAFPVRDIDSPMDSPGMTENDETEIVARLEVLRRTALVYARTLNDTQLIEGFQAPPVAAPAVVVPEPASVSSTNETPEDRDDRRYQALTKAGGDYIEKDGKWSASGPRGLVTKLGKGEKADGRPMSDDKDVRESLKKAAKRAKLTQTTGPKGNSAFNR